MNPENNLGNNEMNSSSLGTLQNDGLNNNVDTTNQTLNNLSALGVESLQNNVAPQTFNVPEQPVAPVNESFESPASVYEPAQNSVPNVEQNNAYAQQPLSSVNAPSEPQINMEAPSFDVNQTVQPLPSEVQEQPTLNDVIMNNYNESTATQIPSATEMPMPEVQAPQVDQPVVNMEANGQEPTGPTLPIPDQMPDIGYQSTVSTPVDYATPMSNFDEIGVTPDIDPKAKQKGKSSKVIAFILIMIVILGLGAGSYYLINVKKIFDKSSVVTKNLTVEQGSTLSEDINDYATFSNTSSANCVQDLSEVDVTKIGSYNYLIKCGDKEYKGTITVTDTTAPTVNLQAVVVKTGDTNVTADSFVKSCSEDNCSYALADGQNITDVTSTKGIKQISIKVSDAAGNTQTVAAPIIVIENSLNLGLLAEKELTTSSEYSVNEKIAVLYSDLTYMSYTIYEIKFSDSAVYQTYAKSNGEGTAVTVGDFTGIGVFNEKENKITIVSENINSLVQGSYSLDRQALIGVGYDVQAFASDHLEVLNY